VIFIQFLVTKELVSLYHPMDISKLFETDIIFCEVTIHSTSPRHLKPPICWGSWSVLVYIITNVLAITMLLNVDPYYCMDTCFCASSRAKSPLKACKKKLILMKKFTCYAWIWEPRYTHTHVHTILLYWYKRSYIKLVAEQLSLR
jgi:hypothetical protein